MKGNKIKLSRKEIIATVVSLSIIFIISFFIGTLAAKKENQSLSAINISRNGSSLEPLSKLNEEEKNEQLRIKQIQKEKMAAELQKKANENQQTDEGKIAYLTFDDGPSTTVTPRILETLKKYNVNATFFVIGNLVEENPGLVKEEKEEGNTVANHTYSHNYNSSSPDNIYRSTTAFVNDVIKGEEVLKSVFGDYSLKLIRFPGGSFDRPNCSFAPFRDAIKAAGYNYVDWNIDSYDTKAVIVPADTIYNNVVEQSKNKKKVIILMHDAPVKKTTADALPRIIEYLKSQGYVFKIFQ